MKINVTIEFTDGEIKEIKYVDDLMVRDGVLSLYQDRPFSGGNNHLGSWPLVNIKGWHTKES